MVLNSSLNVFLPPNFMRPPPNDPTTIPTVLPGEDGKQMGEKKKKSEEVESECAVKKLHPHQQIPHERRQGLDAQFRGKMHEGLSQVGGPVKKM
jgi:hypothetical protein